jgi:serine/threonine protein kinase
MDSAELGHFSLLEKIGEGGMGRVYKARDMRLGRLVALKLLAEARLDDASRRARFVQEAKALCTGRASCPASCRNTRMRSVTSRFQLSPAKWRSCCGS